MSAPTYQDVRSFLENYNISETQLSNSWISARINNFVIPYVERITRLSFSEIKSVTEYYSGTGSGILFLNRRPIVGLTSIQYVIGGDYQFMISTAMIDVITEQGILKVKTNFSENNIMPVFARGQKNIKVVYTYGYSDYPDDVKEAIIYLAASRCLSFVGARTGGGSLGIQSHSRNYGNRGKYTDVINNLDLDAHFLLSKYCTSVVGS